MSPVVGRVLLVVSTLTLFHAAFSAFEHLSLLKALDRPQDKRLPLDIIIESVVAFTLFIVGVIIHAPPLKEITWASEMSRKSIEEMDSRMSFASVTHRGPKLFSSSK